MKHHKLKIRVDNQAFNSIESAIEDLFDELNINEAYFANVLNVANHLIDLARKHQEGDELSISIHSDYCSLAFKVDGLKSKLLQELQMTMTLDDELNLFRKDIFLIQSLVDHYSFGKNRFEYTFNVEALPANIFKQREYALQNYFSSLEKLDKLHING